MFEFREESNDEHLFIHWDVLSIYHVLGMTGYWLREISVVIVLKEF